MILNPREKFPPFCPGGLLIQNNYETKILTNFPQNQQFKVSMFEKFKFSGN